MKINICKNGHYFLQKKCPFCGEKVIKEVDSREGDCIACGQLCPDGAYACDKPNILEF